MAAKVFHTFFRLNTRPLDRETGRGPGRLRPHMLLIVVTMLAIVGALLAAREIVQGDDDGDAVLPAGAYVVAQNIPTSFGRVAVEHVLNLNGLTAKDTAGMSHGIQNFVAADKVQVQVAVIWTNASRRAVPYSPEQFRLHASHSKQAIEVVAANIRPGTLQPGTSVEGILSFVAPRDQSQLWLDFRDPGAADPFNIALGNTDQAPKDALDGFHHSQAPGAHDQHDGH